VLAQNRLAKYGSFMANVATAKTADEVAKAIEIAALPVGSSRVKRETIFNVAVNAYVGPFIGYERIRGVDSSGKVNSYGITAPIGVSLSKGYSVLFSIQTTVAHHPFSSHYSILALSPRFVLPTTARKKYLRYN